MNASRRTSRGSSAGFGIAVGLLVVIIVVLVGILIRNTGSEENESDADTSTETSSTQNQPTDTTTSPSTDTTADTSTDTPDTDALSDDADAASEDEDTAQDAPEQAQLPDDRDASTNPAYENASVTIQSPTSSTTVSANEEFEAVARVSNAVADEELKIEFTVYRGDLKVKNFSYPVGVPNGPHNYITGALSAGTYTLTVGLVDADGNRVGERATVTFTVE